MRLDSHGFGCVHVSIHGRASKPKRVWVFMVLTPSTPTRCRPTWRASISQWERERNYSSALLSPQMYATERPKNHTNISSRPSSKATGKNTTPGNTSAVPALIEGGEHIARKIRKPDTSDLQFVEARASYTLPTSITAKSPLTRSTTRPLPGRKHGNYHGERDATPGL